jgi:hypothetical protein
MNRVKRAHRRADCALVGAMALVALSGVSAYEFALYTKELQTGAALPVFIHVTDSPIALVKQARAVEAECLAQVMYYEARGEGIEGEKAVAEVVLQRAHEPQFPDTVCGVVYDGVQPDRRDCQFSFACDGTLSKPKDRAAWRRMRQLAEKIMTGAVRLSGTTGRAIAYHNVDVAPAWAETMLKTAEIGNHVFYKRDPLAQQRVAQAQLGRMEVSPSDIVLPPPLITVDTIRPSEEIQPQVQTAGAVGDGA